MLLQPISITRAHVAYTEASDIDIESKVTLLLACALACSLQNL